MSTLFLGIAAEWMELNVMMVMLRVSLGPAMVLKDPFLQRLDI
jgi:hypothetical protein